MAARGNRPCDLRSGSGGVGVAVTDESKPFPASVSDPPRFSGPRRRSWRHGCVVLLGALVIAAVLAALVSWQGRFTMRTTMLAIVDGMLFCWGAFWLLDRRVYFDLSTDGVWCRRWGSKRIAFSEIKSVYPRRRGILVGVVLVPRDPDQLSRQLSWIGRQAFSSGDFGHANPHTNTLTIWTNRLDLPQAEFLLALRAAIQTTPTEGKVDK